MIKKLFLLFLIFYPISIKAISAEAYVVMDADSKRVLAGSNIHREKLIASTTKIMTCIIALENKNLDTIVKVGDEVLKAYGSAIYLSLNEEITLRDLLYGLMLRSGNDAAIEIAYSVSGNMESFVKLMNEKAYELGMSHTKFINNHGLENDDKEGNMSTAYDMALLMAYALNNDTFKEIIHTKSYTSKTSGKTYVWQNKNKLLFTYDAMIGGKTGYTKKALRTLVTAASKDNKTTIVVTLNDGNDFTNHKNLHEQYLNSYERVLLLSKDTIIDPTKEDKYYLKNDVYALLNENEKNNIKIDYEINDNSGNEEAGVAKIYLKEKLLMTEKIYQRKEFIKEEKESFFTKFFRWLFHW